MGETVTDPQLVDQSLRGDREAFRLLVERYQGKLFRFVSTVVRSREDAEDIVQESFVKAYLSLKSFRKESSFYTWIYRIAYNMAIDFKRKMARRGNSVELSEIEKSLPGDANATPIEQIARKEQGEKMQTALAELTEEHKTVVVLREVDGLSYDEIAQVLGISKGTVMSRLHYARKKLQSLLKEFAPEGFEESSDVKSNHVHGERSYG